MLRRSNMLIEIEQYGKVVRSSGATYPIFLRAITAVQALLPCVFAREKKSPHPLCKGESPN